MDDNYLRVDASESANLRARAPFDKTAAVLEETLRALLRCVADSKYVITRCAAQLVELEGEAAAVGEAVGSAASAKVPKPPRQADSESLKPPIPWCTDVRCTMWQGTRHVHKARPPAPEEVPP